MVMEIARANPGLHVVANLEGMTIGGVPCGAGPGVPGVVVGRSGSGIYVTVKLDSPIGGGERGLLGRTSHGEDMVSLEPDRVEPRDPAEFGAVGVPDEVVALARAGKTLKAIKAYRAMNGATLNEAQAAIRDL
jgi:hypothetical protein